MTETSSLLWKAYTQPAIATQWCQGVERLQPTFIGCFGFTTTGLIPGISAAGATPEARKVTALADAEILLSGSSRYLPTSPDGYPSPVVISRAVLQGLAIPQRLFDCGLPQTLPGLVPVGGSPPRPAACLSTGQALPKAVVQHLFEEGYEQGEQMAIETAYFVLGECVVGGTTTALAVLMGLGWDVAGMINSSHPTCNHEQKLALAQAGLGYLPSQATVFDVLAAVGDPMQPFAAGLALAASRESRVLLAGGTQMLAVYALMDTLAQEQTLTWDPHHVVVGTTRWVAEDPTGNTVGLAERLGQIPLLASQLSFASSHYAQLQAYEQGYVKEGVGAGGLAITAGLYGGWGQPALLQAIESTYADLWQAGHGPSSSNGFQHL